MRPQEQTDYDNYKNLVYRYLRRSYPEADEGVQRRILKRIWHRAIGMELLSGKEDDRKVTAALLALTEQEIHRIRMQESWKAALYRKEGEEHGEKSAEEA